jgi:hypothetical protein
VSYFIELYRYVGVKKLALDQAPVLPFDLWGSEGGYELYLNYTTDRQYVKTFTYLNRQYRRWQLVAT